MHDVARRMIYSIVLVDVTVIICHAMCVTVSVDVGCNVVESDDLFDDLFDDPSDDSSNSHQTSCKEPQIKKDDPLNLSILISGGKETNMDSRSNGE